MIPNLNIVKSFVSCKVASSVSATNVNMICDTVTPYSQNNCGRAKISKLVLYAVNVFGETTQTIITIIFLIICDTVISTTIDLHVTFYMPAINCTPAIILHHRVKLIFF